MNFDSIIRPLDYYESFYDHEVLNGVFLLSRVFITSVPKTLRIDSENLNKALEIWVTKNTLLRSRIRRTEKYNIRSPKFFVLIEKPFKEYNNFEIQESENDLRWMEIIENELVTPLDYDNGPLWRMKIVKINEKEETRKINEYHFIFTSHHSIADGRNCFELMVQFFNILGLLLENKTNVDLKESVQETNHSLDELSKIYQAQLDYIGKMEDETQYEHRIPGNIGNKESKAPLKLECIFLESMKLNKISERLKFKAPKAKLTSFLITLLCLAYKKTCTTFDVKDITLESFKISLLVSLREKFKLSNLQMGVYSKAMLCKIVDELNEKTFWSITEKLSLNLHEKIKMNEEIETLKKMDEIYDLVMNNFEWSKNHYRNFSFSNIGIMKNTNTNAIKIQKHFVGMSNLENRIASPLFNGITTLDSNLCWTISYDERAFCQKFIQALKQEILRLIDTIIL